MFCSARAKVEKKILYFPHGQQRCLHSSYPHMENEAAKELHLERWSGKIWNLDLEMRI
jgi:hypothetical protein